MANSWEIQKIRVRWVSFVGPWMVRYFVGDIVSSQLGWGNSREYRKERCGGGFTQPVMILMVLFRDTSSFLVWELRLHSGVTYSALL